jgi:hypothetical protein
MTRVSLEEIQNMAATGYVINEQWVPVRRISRPKGTFALTSDSRRDKSPSRPVSANK